VTPPVAANTTVPPRASARPTGEPLSNRLRVAAVASAVSSRGRIAMPLSPTV
jgi:hypothetical protein